MDLFVQPRFTFPFGSSFFDGCAAGPDADAHDKKVGRIRRAHADHDIQSPKGALVVVIERLVDADVERHVIGEAEERAAPAFTREELADAPLELLPQPLVVRIEYRPADAFLD